MPGKSDMVFETAGDRTERTKKILELMKVCFRLEATAQRRLEMVKSLHDPKDCLYCDHEREGGDTCEIAAEIRGAKEGG